MPGRRIWWLFSVLFCGAFRLETLGAKAYAVSSIIYTALFIFTRLFVIHCVTVEDASSKKKLEKRKLLKVKASESLAKV